VYDTVVVEVCDGREGCADQVRCVGLEVGALAADAVEELAAKGEVGDEVDCVRVSKELDMADEYAILRLFMVSK
jgi:hypothetical protein